MLSATEIDKVYDTLAATYPLFEDSDDEWMTHGLSDTPLRALISVALSTMTNGPRTVKAAVGLYEKVSTFEQLRDIDDDELRDTIRSVNRLGMVDTRTHEQTADALIDVTPTRFVRHAHEWLIQHGMQTCVARKPKCDDCPLTALCAYYRAA